MDLFKNKRKMRLHNSTFVLLFISIIITGNAQDVNIAGGGTLMDWAHLKFYQESNEKLKNLEEQKVNNVIELKDKKKFKKKTFRKRKYYKKAK